MKKITTLFALLISVFAIIAAPVEPEQARNIALNFMMQKSPMVTRSTDCTLAYTKSNDRSTALLYVYNVGNGFVIVSADDVVRPVLGYSTNGTFSSDNMPDNFRAWLQDYADQIAYVKEHNLSASETVQQEWTDLEEGRVPSRSGNSRAVEPLITTTWGTGEFYNSLCPEDTNSWNGHAYATNMATAMAQIINYHQYPAHGYRTHSYSDSYYGDLSVNLENSTYQYNLMPNSLEWNYDEATDEWEEPNPQQVNAVATLIRDCDASVNSGWNLEDARVALVSHFGYDADILYRSFTYRYVNSGFTYETATYTYFNDSTWVAMLKNELDNQRPFLYSAVGRYWGQDDIGVEFVCDGYDADDFFHFNWGWDGNYDGYYAIDSIYSEDYHHGSILVGDQGTGFRLFKLHRAVFLHPHIENETFPILLGSGGATIDTINEPTIIENCYGENVYQTCAYVGSWQSSGATNLMDFYSRGMATLYPENAGDQLWVDVISNAGYHYIIYDGADALGDTIGMDLAAGTFCLSTQGAVTIAFLDYAACTDFKLMVTPVSCVPFVHNFACLNKEFDRATLAWDVYQQEYYATHWFNWQLEYGPQGFTPGTGTTLSPDDNTVLLTGLEAGTYYDAYLTYICANHETVTLEPLTFKTPFMTDCYEPIGIGTTVQGVGNTQMNLYNHYSMSQYIFTAEELANIGLTSGDMPSTIWLQYPNDIPSSRVAGIYMGQTAKTRFESPTDWFNVGDLIPAYPEKNTLLTNTNPDYWFAFPFDNILTWDGESNLVIALVSIKESDTLIHLNRDFFDIPYYTQNHNVDNSLIWNGSSAFSMENSGTLARWRPNIKFCAATNCMAPTNLSVTNLSRTEVRLDWDRMYQENEWTVEYGLHGFEIGNGTSVTVTDNPTTVIADMEHGYYDFYVRAECGGSNHSRWRVDSAYVMGNNDCVELLGNDLSSGELVATGYRYYTYCKSQQIFYAEDLREMGLQPGEPIYQLSVQYSHTDPLTRKMAVYMANTDKSAFDDNSDWFDFGVLTNVFPEAYFTFEGRSSEENYRWSSFDFDVPFVWDGSSNVVVAFADQTGSQIPDNNYGNKFFQHTGHTNNTLSWRSDQLPTSESYGGLSNFLSNIRFCEGCMRPFNITYETPSRHEVVFTWQPGNGESEWHIEYGPAGFEQGSGTLVTMSGEPTLTVSQLGRGGWDFYFQSECGADNISLWKKITVIMGDEGNTECVQIGNGNTTSTKIPLGYNGYDDFYTYVQELYTANELLEQGISVGNNINALSFQYSGSDKAKGPVTIWLGNTSRTQANNSVGFIPTTEMQQVFHGALPLSEGWVDIQLDRSFVWDGSNLVVAVLNNSGSDDRATLFYGHSMSPNMTLYKYNWYEIDPDDSYTYTTDFRNNIRFCTDGGCTLQRTIDALVNEGDSYDFYGRGVSEQGTYTHRFYVDEECDSLITLNLTVRKIIYVTPTGAGSRNGTSWQHAMQLQEAMDTVASYTDVTPFIYVKKGTYTGNTSSSNSYEIKPNVRAYGGFNGDEAPYFDLDDRNLTANTSTLNGSNARRVLFQAADFADNQATLLDGFTIRNGAPDNVGDGGAVYLRKNTTLRNCAITSTNATINGSSAVTRNGIVVYNDGGTLENCRIFNNSVTLTGTGSGHKVYGVGIYNRNGIVLGCTLNNNTTVYDGTGNNWNVYGGGIYLTNGGTIANSTLTLNSASEGGALYLSNDNNTSINDCVISNNTARNNGGGVYNSSTPRFTQCLIGNNVAGANGGGVYNSGQSTFNNCNIVRNSAASNAGGIYTSSSTLLNNTIIWGNKVGNNANQIASSNSNTFFTMYSCALQGSYSGAITLQENNNGTGMGYPMFANPTSEAGVDATNQIGDWTLQEGSFCIGLGNNSLATTETDLAGNERIQQGRVDIGCYESAHGMAFPLHPEESSNIIYVTTTGAGVQDGTSWNNATANLQYAMDVAMGCTPPATVWMAQGTYTQANPHIVQPKVAVYGSFAGNEPYSYDLTQRDFENHATILDGENSCRILDKTSPFAINRPTVYYTEPVEINMLNTGTLDIVACSGTIYDDGGPNGNFSANCNGEVIIRSYNPNGTITISGSYNNSYNGRLKIYDGIDGMELGNYNYNGNLSLTATSGVMVIQFTSSTSSLNSGFELHFSCSDCEPDVPEEVVSFRHGESLFDGITVQNGYSGSTYHGGAYLYANTDLLNCTFQNNSNRAVYADNCSIDHCTFNNNTGYGLEGNSLTISNSTMANNSSIGIYGSNLALSNCIVENNNSNGISVSTNSTITECIVRDNSNGGISISGGGKVDGCIVTNNGGGINSNGAQVFNTTITNNNGTGLYTTGGLYVNVNVANNTTNGSASGVYASSGAQFTNCHIVNNLSTYNYSNAGGVYNNGTTNQFTNCVIWGNMRKTTKANLYGTATYAYCAVEGGVDGTSNITLDSLNSGGEAGVFYPNFVNPSDTVGTVNDYHYDYSLGAGSACINQGIANTTSLNLPMYDLAGSLRIKQGRIDIGAYEYGGLIVNRVNDSICLGEDFYYGELYVYPEETGLYLDTVTYYENGQDYIAYIALQTNPTYNQYIDTAICEGESIFFDGEERTETGEYIYYGQTQSGCDSIVTLNLTTHHHSSSSFNVTRCDSYTWNGTTYYESGVYTQVFEAANGCDSTVTLTLTIDASTEYEFDQQACVVYNWNGVSYRQSGDYVQHFRNAAGCDSTVTMHLTILDVFETEFADTACDSYTWNDETYTTGGDKVQFLESSLGCDSIVTLHLTLYQSAERNIYRNACDSYTWNDETYTTSGDYTQHFTTVHGCDSTVHLHLTVNYSNSSEFAHVACDSYTWNNETYTESGDYQQILTNAVGCDSTVTLHLTVNHSNSYEFDDEACGVYVWNNEIYTESGDYQQVLTNAAGCDSMVTLHLIINPEYNIPIAETICRSQLPYTYNNGQINHTFGVETPGQITIAFPLTSTHGCDSTITLTLTVTPIYDITLEESICRSDLPYQYVNGEINVTFGTETPALSSVPFHLTSSNGCDSTVTLQLTVNSTYLIPAEATICESELPYHYVNGQIDTTFHEGTPESATYDFHLSTAQGCDSTISLTLTVIPNVMPQLAVDGIITACQSSSATLSVPGNYSIYNWSTGATTPTITVTTPGYYYVELTDMYGCSSISEITQLGVSTLITETPAICMVGVENGHNLIVWEELENTNVQNYRIYRENEQANIYELLATVPASQGNAYEDITADPSVRAYRYKVTAMDVCQGETPMSELHKTVHLTINQGIGNTWNLIWTHYEGIEFSSYRLYRGSANNNLTLIATLPSTLTSYTDYDNVDGALFYQIEVVMNGSCQRTTRDVTYTGARSNIVYNGEIVYTDTAVIACESYEWIDGIHTQSGVYQHNYTSELGYDVHALLNLTIFATPAFSINGETTLIQGSGMTAVLSVVPNDPQWSYLWSNGATTNFITVSPNETTTYSVTVTNGACEETSSATVTVISGVDEYGLTSLRIYPNPTDDIINVEIPTLNNISENIEIQIFDIYGRRIYTAEVSNDLPLQIIPIDLSQYATGVYIIKALNSGKTIAIGKAVRK